MKDIINRSIPEIREAMANKEISCRELVLEYLARIARFDRVSGGVNSIAEINPDALFIADHLDKMRAEGKETGPLYGIPVMLKDNIDTGDKMSTTAGSLALAHNFAREDAFTVKKLRKAGALIMGKTNLSEFAQFLTSKSPSGYSSRGGQVLNPYNPGGETPGGSSSGSGVAVAARFCAASVGSDTCGSIMSPTAQNGLAGIRPTKGLISCSGVIPISNTMDTTGPMARSVEDMAIMLGVMAGRDENDATTWTTPESVDYINSLTGPSGLKDMRIGVNMSGYEDKKEEERKAFDSFLNMLGENGAVLVRGQEGLDFAIEYAPMQDVMDCEFKQSLNLYLNRHPGHGPRSMEEIIAFNQNNPAVMLKYGQGRMLLCNNETTGAQTDTRYLRAMALRETEIKKMDRLFDDNRLDAVVRISFSTITPLLGFPSMSIPIGQKANGVPMGVCVIAKRFREDKMIRLASAAEKVLGLDLSPDLESRYPELN